MILNPTFINITSKVSEHIHIYFCHINPDLPTVLLVGPTVNARFSSLSAPAISFCWDAENQYGLDDGIRTNKEKFRWNIRESYY